MRAMAVVIALLCGCASQSVPPSRIVVSPDAYLSSDTSAMERIRKAAELWSGVGATVEIGEGGITLRSVPATEWNHLPTNIGSEDADGNAIEIQREAFAALPAGEQILTLAHEMGHALGLWHVDDQYAVMYRYVNHPLAAEGLTKADAAEYFSVYP